MWKALQTLMPCVSGRCYHHAPCLNNLAIKEITLWAVHSNMSCRANPLKSWLMNGCSQSELIKGRCSSELLVWYDRIFLLFDFSCFVLFLYKLFFRRVKFYLPDLMMRLIGVFIWKYSAVWALWASDRLVACQRHWLDNKVVAILIFKYGVACPLSGREPASGVVIYSVH